MMLSSKMRKNPQDGRLKYARADKVKTRAVARVFEVGGK